MADRSAFVDDLHPVGLEIGQVIGRVASRGFDDLDPGLDDGLPVLVVGNGIERRQQGQIDAERLVGEIAAALNFFPELLGRRRMVRDDEAQRSCIGHSRHQGRMADAGHSAHHNGRLDAEHVRNAGVDHEFAVPRIIFEGRS